MTHKQDTYRGWNISFDPPPIPVRDFDWRAYGPNYDASYEGEEDGFVDNGEKAFARTRAELCAEVDEIFAERDRAASADTHRMAETGTGSGRSLSGAVPSEETADAQILPKDHP